MRISDWSSDVCSSDLLPTVGASADATRTRSQLVPNTDPAMTNRYSVGVGVTSFELDFWGWVKNLSEAARSQYLATDAAERAFRLALVRDVARWEEPTSELQSLLRSSSSVFCL